MADGPLTCGNCANPLPARTQTCPTCGESAVPAPLPEAAIPTRLAEPGPADAPSIVLPIHSAKAVGHAEAPGGAKAGHAEAPAAKPAIAPPPPQGRPHSPAVAVFLGVVLPGAGQAYNGHPFKAFFFLFFSPLFLPWLWSLVDAHRSAGRLVAEGGRYERGGWIWVFLQAWLAFNAVLFALIVLTLCGVLT